MVSMHSCSKHVLVVNSIYMISIFSKIIIIIINLIYVALFDTNGILTALSIVITYIQMQYMHI